jgi:hypothetical protein
MDAAITEAATGGCLEIATAGRYAMVDEDVGRFLPAALLAADRSLP